MQPIRRALISVSDKTDIADFGTEAVALGIQILSTGGTAKHLRDHGVAVVEVSEHTGFPEIMDGRVKTLHPRIHGGLLGRGAMDAAAMAEHGIEPIDLLVVNLYPFERTVADQHCDPASALENIDIGGVALLRAAAKNYTQVVAVVEPNDYPQVLRAIRANAGQVDDRLRFELARKVFEYTAAYEAHIAAWFGRVADPYPKPLLAATLQPHYRKHQALRYGENPHQSAAFYVPCGHSTLTGIAAASQLQGKQLSYNNIVDADTALECVQSFTDPACVIVKHANPCGVAVGANPKAAYERAYATDPISAFGGIIAFNRPLDAATAAALIERQFVEVITAPAVDNDALRLLEAKDSIRVLVGGDTLACRSSLDFKQVGGGVLVQQHDRGEIGQSDCAVVSERAPDDQQWLDLLFAWRVVKYVKSNAIVYARNQRTVAIGAGQMSRVDSARIASLKATDAGSAINAAVLASDAFFPFRDSIDTAATAGISAIIQPGGSIRDHAVIAAANEHNMAMVFTGMRHFRH